MNRLINRRINGHLRENIRSYIFLIVFFIGGVAAGAYYSFLYGTDVSEYMGDFFKSVISIIKTDGIDCNSVFKAACLSSFKSAFFVWLLGFTVIGSAVTLFIIFKCGFMLGFATTFLIRIFSYKAIPAAVISMLCQCTLYIPALLFLSCASMRFSGIILKTVTGKMKYRTNFRYFILQYITYLLPVLVVLVLYSLAEAYAGANLLRLYIGN